MESELTEDREMHLVRCVQQGQDDAWTELVSHYRGMLRNIARQCPGDREENLTLAETNFYFCVMEHETGRLGRYKNKVLDLVFREATLSAATESIPDRTWQRFWSILKKADYSPVTGAAICGQYGMSVRSFLTVYGLAHAESVEDLDPRDLEPIRDEEAERLACIALASITIRQEAVVRAAYMGDEGRESDATVSYLLTAETLGVAAANRGERVLSTRTVHRERTTAMATMRKTLGVGDEEKVLSAA